METITNKEILYLIKNSESIFIKKTLIKAYTIKPYTVKPCNNNAKTDCNNTDNKRKFYTI